jgi:capsular polysaccharide biosynthesis protein
MGPETQLRPRRYRPLPELDAEEELDLGRYWNALLARWWLPVAGLVAGVAVGYLLSLGGHQVYQAKSQIYLGQPLSPNGTSQVQSLSTNPATVRQIVQAPYFQHKAEVKAGLPIGSLRSNVSTQSVSGSVGVGLGRVGQNPLVNIVVTGKRPAKIAIAADALGTYAVRAVSAGYVDTKIHNFQEQIKNQTEALKRVDQNLATLQQSARNPSLSITDRLIIASSINGQSLQRGQIAESIQSYQQLLALAKNVEQSKLLISARASKTTAQSRRNSVLVGAVIGLLLGILAALLWEPAARLARRTAA